MKSGDSGRDGPDTLLVHGWATDSSVWEGRNAITRGTVVAIDLPGHGSAAVWDTPTLCPAVKEIEAAVSSMPSGGVIGIGWSLGACALISAALKAPGRFSSLVLVGATPCFVQRDGFLCAQPRALVKRMIMDMKKAPEQTLARFYSLNFTPGELAGEGAKEFIARYKYPGPVRCDGPVPGCFPAFRYGEITKALEALYDTDLRARLGEMEMPVLVVHGALDSVCPVGAGRHIAGRIKGARIEVFEEAGHAPFLTEPHRFDSIVNDFLRTVS
ncbi:MAG: alpha/beta fold hydrolase [Thermodesulfobacteriota bacterium]